MKKIFLPAFAALTIGVGFNSYSQTLNNTTTAQKSAVPATSIDDKTKPAKEDDTPVDGYFNTEAYDKATPFNYASVDKNNVKVYKRIWRDVDLNDKGNDLLAIPGMSLTEVIMKGLQDGKITAYSPIPTADNPSGDGFKTKMTYNEIMDMMTDSVLVPEFNELGEQISEKWAKNDFNPERISKYRIKEDIFYDKQRGRTETRIVGIAPMQSVTVGDQNFGQAVVCWLYFPELRKTLVTQEISDPERNLNDMSMDDLFIQRRFAGNIVKESNAMGVVTKDYTQDADMAKASAAAEARIKAFKEKMWSYNKNTTKDAKPATKTTVEKTDSKTASASKSEPVETKNTVATITKLEE